MQRPHHRPRLDLRIDRPADDVRDALDARIAAGLPGCIGRSGRRHVFVEIDEAHRHAWSPTLDIVLREEDGATRLLGRFGPSPSLWTATMFVYGLAGFVATASACGALAQRITGEAPTLMWAVVAAFALGLGTFLSTRVGALLGHPQMLWLARVLDGLGEVRADEAHVLSELHPVDGADGADGVAASAGAK